MKANMNYQNFHYLMRVLIIYLDAVRSMINTIPELIFMGEYGKLKRMGFFLSSFPRKQPYTLVQRQLDHQ